MNQETPKCKDCGQEMFEICNTGVNIGIGGMETMIVNGMEHRQYVHKGIRIQKLYQCPEDKTIAVD